MSSTSPPSASTVVFDRGATPNGSAAALSSGTLISSSSTYSTRTANRSVFMGKTFQGQFGGSVQKGDWANVQANYLGLQFVASKSTYYGWAELSDNANAGVGTLLGSAYDTNPGEAIAAGQTTPSALPEPSSIALTLLALGSVGVAALHRSRREARATPAA